MNKNCHRRGEAGFSLIEVLIAVVILSFGVLALTALQTKLIQSSAEAKAQSVALALAKDRLEEMRGFQCVASCGQSYLGLTSGSDTQNDSNGDLGGVNFRRSWTVKRYVLPVGGTTFCEAGSSGACAGVTNTSTLSASFAPNNEYKVIDVRVAWNDATGAERVVAMEDAIAGLDPVDSARNRRNRGARPRGPEVIIVDPSSEDGVIPIAIGDGSETAATNPKPVNVNRAGSDAIETRFEVLTYAALSGDRAVAQSRVETTVVGCECSFATTTNKGYRPTYWDGYRYAPPLQNTTNAVARTKNVVQSRYCDACCRDHHDAGASGPKFSPRLTSHQHYLKQSGVLQAVTTGDYAESCRLIRVDGVFRVAADLSNDYYNLLATESNFSGPAPSTSNPDAVAGYQGFVLDYVNGRFVPSVVPGSQSSAQTAYNNNAWATADAVAEAKGLNLPAQVGMSASSTARPTEKTKWLHSRGLYIDYLEPAAVDAIGDARLNCKNLDGTPKTGNALRDCVLKVLPFTSINLTELADWQSEDEVQVKVTATSDFDTSISPYTNPIRGKVTPGSNPTSNSLTDITTTTTRSNSGVAVMEDISPAEATAALTDAQTFKMTSGGAGQAGGSFQLNVSNYGSVGTLDVGYVYGGRDDVCSATASANPFVCTTRGDLTETLPATITVRIGHYNKSGFDTVSNTCTNSPNDTTEMPYRVVYDVQSVTSSNASAQVGSFNVVRDGLVGSIPAGEYTEVSIESIAQGDVITATLTAPTYMCPRNYPGSGQSLGCAGNGGGEPTWSTTYVSCPDPTAAPNF